MQIYEALNIAGGLKKDQLASKAMNSNFSGPRTSRNDKEVRTEQETQEDLADEEYSSKFESKKSSSKMNEDEDTEDVELRRERR